MNVTEWSYHGRIPVESKSNRSCSHHFCPCLFSFPLFLQHLPGTSVPPMSLKTGCHFSLRLSLSLSLSLSFSMYDIVCVYFIVMRLLFVIDMADV